VESILYLYQYRFTLVGIDRLLALGVCHYYFYSFKHWIAFGFYRHGLVGFGFCPVDGILGNLFWITRGH